MLHKSFKPAKCKTALKLASSRTKLLKNKKDAQVKQLKRDVAQLLESGQDQTARIRVEHVVREEKMMAAYDLIEIFCELIASRLQIIESQKNCPIDLKEAVTSVVFASPRCADIPELMDVRKHFTAKYGKEFINAAVELRPDCGVNRMLVEKLSAVAPDGPTKMKILTAIAEEHNVKWEPKSFGEKDSKYSEDLLNGPKTFEDASKMHVGAPKGPPSVNATPQMEWKQNASPGFQENNIGSSFGYQHSTQAHPGVSTVAPSELKPSVDEREPMDRRRAYSGDMKDGFMGNQDWNMEFRDATAAAQAAAESAERASMAARAAAELSSRGRSGEQYASELQKPSSYAFRDEYLERSRGSSYQSEVFAREQAGTNIERTHRMQNEQTNNNEHYYHKEAAEKFQREGQKDISKSSQFGSSKSGMDSVDDDLLSRSSVYSQNDERHVGRVDPYSHDEAAVSDSIRNSLKTSIPRMQRNQIDANRQDDVEEVTENFYRESHNYTPEFSQSYSINSNTDSSHVRSSLNSSLPRGVHSQKNSSGPVNNRHILDDENLSRNSSRFEAEFVHEIPHDVHYENSNDREGTSYRKHSTHVSSHLQTSFSRSSSDRQDVWNLNNDFEDDVTENPFASLDEGKSHKDTGAAYGGSAVHYDNYGDDGSYSFDLDKGPESSFDYPSASGGSLSHTFSDNHTPIPWGIAADPIQKITSQSPFFAEQHSPKVSQSVAGSGFHEEPGELPPPSFDKGPCFDKEVEPEDFSGNDENDSSTGSPKKYVYAGMVSSPKQSSFTMNSKNCHSFDDLHDEESHQGGHHLESSFIPEIEDNKFEVQLPDSSDDSGSKLSFGKLTGGLRNKGYKRPPYVRSSMEEASSPEEAEKDSPKKSSVSSPLKVSVDSISHVDPHSKDKGTEFRKRPVTRLSASGTNVGQDGISLEDSSARLTSHDFLGSSTLKSSPEMIKRSSSRESIASTNSMQSNTDNDLQTQVSSGKTHFAPGLSRRTKPAPPNTVRVKSTFAPDESAPQENRSGRAASLRSSYQESTFTSEKPENLIHGSDVKSSPRSSYFSESSVKPKSGTKAAASSSHIASSSSKSKFVHEEFQTQELDEDIKYSWRSSYATDTSMKSQSGTRTAALSSDRLGSKQTRLRYASEESQTERDGSVKSSVRSSYASGSSMESQSETDQSDYQRTAGGYRLPKEATNWPTAKPTGSSPGGSLRSRPEEKRSPSLEKTSGTSAAPESLKSAGSSADTDSRENSFKKASHVHPKLPDYDTFAATLHAFRANRE